MVVEMHVGYLAVSGEDGQNEFHTDKENLGHSCSQGWEFCRIKACTMADDNYGVSLEILRKFLT
jgi:hypothetical protein